MGLSFGLLSVCPRVRRDGGRLVAVTSWKMWLLSLCSLSREVVVDPGQQCVIIRRRVWLFARRRRIAFGRIKAVTYGYQDWAAGSLWSWAHDSADLFSTGLRLHDGREVHLFYFLGDGTFHNDGPLPDWLYWPDFLPDFSGTQEKESRAFVELLSKLIGVAVEPASR